MSYTQWKDGYAKETTFKDGTTINDAADTAYKLGAIHKDTQWPSPEFEAMYNPVAVNAREVAAGNIWKSQATMRGVVYFIPQNGIPIWLTMGLSSTAGAGPYTHTITPTTDSSLLPSIVIQHEEKGTATDEEYQFQGVKVDSLTLSHDMQEGAPNVLTAKMEIMAAYALDPGFALTNDPALPATANTAAYSALTRTWDYGSGNVAINGLRSVDINIINGLMPLYAHSWTAGVYTGQWPYAFAEAPMKQYVINLVISKNTIERSMWDELLSLSNTKEAYFKWTRSANDYIAVTATDCQVTRHDILTPAGDKRDDVVGVDLYPRALSFSVVDSIAGGAYGE